jgi:Leucine rich repeat
VYDTDFEGLTSLRILSLANNQLHTIEKDALQDLQALERLLVFNFKSFSIKIKRSLCAICISRLFNFRDFA